MKISKKGAAQIEFIIVLPILILLSFGAFELYRFVTLNTSLKTSAYNIALWSSRDASASFINQTIDVITLDYPDLAVSTNASVIVTGLTAGLGTQNTIKWAILRGSGTSNVTPSNPILYDSVLYQGPIDSIVVEINYNYVPLFFGFASKILKYQVCIDYRGSNFPQM